MSKLTVASRELHGKLRDTYPTLNIFCDPRSDDCVWFELMHSKTVNQHDVVAGFMIAVRDTFKFSGEPNTIAYCLYLTEPTINGPDEMFLDVDKLMAHVAKLVPQ